MDHLDGGTFRKLNFSYLNIPVAAFAVRLL